MELNKPYGDSVFNIKGMCKIMTDDEQGSEVTAARNKAEKARNLNHVESMCVDERTCPPFLYQSLIRHHTVSSDLIGHP